MNQTTSTRPSHLLPLSFDIRLIDGHRPNEGRLYVTINGRSGTVCNRGWTLLNSQIACQQMGLIVDPQLYLYSRWPDSSQNMNEHQNSNNNDDILMSEVQCDPLDTSLFECRHTRTTDHTCIHDDDVWIKCLEPSWAGIRFGLAAHKSKVQFAVFNKAGQYDYGRGELAAALQFDLMQHIVSNVTFQNNQHTSLEILYNQPFRETVIEHCTFDNNMASGLVTRTAFLKVNQMMGSNHDRHAAVEYDPFFDRNKLDSVRKMGAQPRRELDVRQELTRLRDNLWHIGREETVLLYTDAEADFGPLQFDIQIQCDNNRVLVVDLVDYNTNFDEEQVMLCEKFCQQSKMDPYSREWNISLPADHIFFPINTSYSALHISYNVTSTKSGRLTLLVYSVPAPKPVYDHTNPAYSYILNLMPDNIFKIFNSTFINNRHSIVMRHYDDIVDIFGNLRRRYNYTNLFISNCTFERNDQLLWVNTDPIVNNFHQRANNLTIHQRHSLFDSNKDDIIVSESGYQLYDLTPSVKYGPLGRINITFEDCIIQNNYGGSFFFSFID
jgi:hypothetical protein